MMKSKTLRYLMLLTASFAFATCSNSQDKTNPVFESINTDTFKQKMQNENVVVLDVRTSDEYNSGHIPGAVNLDYYKSFASNVSKLDKSKTYLVYCHSGSRSKSAGKIMSGKGFNTVYNLTGGIQAWNKQNLEIEK